MYMSGYTDDAFVLEAFGKDKSPFHLKPLSPSALVATVRKVLDNALVLP
jgi:hypothetical protein